MCHAITAILWQPCVHVCNCFMIRFYIFNKSTYNFNKNEISFCIEMTKQLYVEMILYYADYNCTPLIKTTSSVDVSNWQEYFLRALFKYSVSLCTVSAKWLHFDIILHNFGNVRLHFPLSIFFSCRNMIL